MYGIENLSGLLIINDYLYDFIDQSQPLNYSELFM